MFWRKKEQKPEEPTGAVQVIPEDFYGARDPVVHYDSVQHARAVSVPKESAGQAAHMVSQLALPMWLKSKMAIIIMLSVLFLAVVAVISWYYINQAKKTAEQNKAPIQTEAPIQEEEAVQEVQPEEIIPTSTIAEAEANVEESATSTVIQQKEPVLEFPDVSLLNSADFDNDSLTDAEEELFGTDSGIWDTDGDAYYDGQEIFNLYNPKGIAPMRIIDSGIVKEYASSVWQYRVYYPSSWALGSVETEENHVLFSAINGEFIEIVAEKMGAGETFADWFARKAPGQKFSDLSEFTNRFQENCWKRNDDFTAYFIRDNNVFALIYHPGSSNEISYGHVMQMAIQSFRPAKTSAILPEQPIVPSEGL